MNWPFHIVFLGQGRPIWDADSVISPPKKKHAATASNTLSGCWSLWKMCPWFSIKGDAHLKLLAFHLAGSAETRDWIICPEVMNMVTDFKHTLTQHIFLKWSHFEKCTAPEQHTTPPGTHSRAHTHKNWCWGRQMTHRLKGLVHWDIRCVTF